MKNKMKGRWFRGIFFQSEQQYYDLIDALNTNDKDEVLDIMFEIFVSGGIK
jgi:hypothetical protein